MVPARKGSRGVPDKNFRDLGGKSLVERALRVASSLPGYCILSTDHELPSLQLYGIITSRRPKHLATDKAPMWSVLRHLYADQGWRDEDTIVLLQPTSLHPDRAAIVKGMLEAGTLPACTVDRYPDRWHPWYAQAEGACHPVPACRQSLPPRYRPNGLAYMMTGKTARMESFWCDNPTLHPVEGVLNIDTPADWEEAEKRYGTMRQVR